MLDSPLDLHQTFSGHFHTFQLQKTNKVNLSDVLALSQVTDILTDADVLLDFLLHRMIPPQIEPILVLLYVHSMKPSFSKGTRFSPLLFILAGEGALRPPFSFRLGEKKTVAPRQKKSRFGANPPVQPADLAAAQIPGCYPATDALTQHPRRAFRFATRSCRSRRLRCALTPGGESKGEGRSPPL